MAASTQPRRRRQSEPSWRRLGVAAIVSVGGHAIVLFNLVVLGLVSLAFPHVNGPSHPTHVGMVQLPASQWAGNRSLSPTPREKSQNAVAAQAPAPEMPKPPQEAERAPGAVKDIATNGQIPEEARFAAEHNNKVTKESASWFATSDRRNTTVHPTTTVPEKLPEGKPTAKKLVAGNNGKADDLKPITAPRTPKRIFEMPDIKARDRLALRFDPSGSVPNQNATDAVQGNSKRLLLQPGAKDGENDESDSSLGKAGQGDNVVNLVPSTAILDKVMGAPAEDITPMDDVEKGLDTFLNAREWKYASFFNRVKQSIGDSWDPSTALRRRDPSGQVYAYKDRYTVLQVVLDPKGALKDVYVEKSCGVDFLDEEAVAAFQRAQPFPNPPNAIVDPHRNEIRFAFGFYLEVTARPALRVFRSGN